MSTDSMPGVQLYKLEKGIPVPVRGREAKYPFAQMEVGDSFLTTGVTRSYISLHARLLRPKKFSCRTVVENGVKGLRVWRVE